MSLLETLPSGVRYVDDSEDYEQPEINTGLYTGEVLEVYLPDDPNNQTKIFVEYKVRIEYFTKRGMQPREFDNVIQLSILGGGQADFIKYTLRANPVGSDGLIKLGSYVLVGFLRGFASMPIILGGLTLVDKETENKDRGHHFDFVFNGIYVNINQDGELGVYYTGKSDGDGNRNKDIDESKVPTMVKLDKEGSFVVTTKNGDQSFTINHKDKKVQILANKEFKVNVKDGKIYLDCDKSTDGVYIGKATDKTLLGETYRNAEKELNNELASQLQSLATQLGKLGGYFGTMAANAATSIDVPGFKATAGTFTSCVEACGQMVAAVVKMKAKITAFESDPNSYLSQRNKSD